MENEQRDFVVLCEGTIASDFELKNLNRALGDAQVKFTPSLKDLENVYHHYMYTPLKNIIDAVRPALHENKITVMQFPKADLEEKTVTIVTRVTHWDSSEWLQNTLELPGALALGKEGAPVFDQKAVGGVITYACKYAYKPICGIADEEEMIDSGEQAGRESNKVGEGYQRQTKRTSPAEVDRQTEKQNKKGKQEPEPGPAPAGDAPPPAETEEEHENIVRGFFRSGKELGFSLGHIKRFIVLAYPALNGSTSSMTSQQIKDSLAVMAENKNKAEEFLKKLEAEKAANEPPAESGPVQ